MNNDFINIEKLISVFSTDFEKTLISFLPKALFFSDKLDKAMYYVVKVGGKRLRPLILSEISSILGIKKENSDRVAAGIEFIHCYSLVHDDLPAMDDDDYRRGMPSCHKKFDEATAILAGDAIQPLALEVLTTIEDKNLKPESKLKIINLFAQACGPRGMVEGQSRDLDAEGKQISLEQLDEIHHLKTGKLIEACVESICVLKEGLPKSHLDGFLSFAKKFGLAFQIKDDILDVIGDEKIIGKPLNSDMGLNKASYPSVIGLEASKERAENLCFEALEILAALPYETDELERLSKFIILRDK